MCPFFVKFVCVIFILIFVFMMYTAPMTRILHCSHCTQDIGYLRKINKTAMVMVLCFRLAYLFSYNLQLHIVT